VIIYFLACAALEACLAKAIWIDLVGGSPPASGGNGCPSRGIVHATKNSCTLANYITSLPNSSPFYTYIYKITKVN
jgi:hypothetical protein